MTHELTVLSKREESSMASTWTEYLCFCAGDEKKYRVIEGAYQALADAAEYYDEETEDYDLPAEIDGEPVVGLQDDFVIGGELDWYSADKTVEFDRVEDERLKKWLTSNSWNNSEVWQALKNAIGTQDGGRSDLHAAAD